MTTERSIIKWHYVTDKDGKPAGLRGWDAQNEDRYEMALETDGSWRVSVVFTFTSEPDDWGFHEVGRGSVFDCMVAAERHADKIYHDESED